MYFHLMRCFGHHPASESIKIATTSFARQVLVIGLQCCVCTAVCALLRTSRHSSAASPSLGLLLHAWPTHPQLSVGEERQKRTTKKRPQRWWKRGRHGCLMEMMFILYTNDADCLSSLSTVAGILQ